MRVHSPKAPEGTFIFAHGAGAGSSSDWMVRYAKELAARGLRVVTFDFPGSRQNGPLERAYLEIVRDVAARFPKEPLSIGGKSMGGRIASQIAAAYPLPLRSLVFFGYPLHPPGNPKKRRDAHLPDVKVPMLFVSGKRDPFGSPAELRALTKKLGADLLLVDGDHSPPLDPAIWDAAATFMLR